MDTDARKEGVALPLALRDLMKNRGFMLVFAIVSLAVLSLIVMQLFTRQAIVADAARSRALNLLNKSTVIAGELWRDQQLQALAERVGTLLEANLAPSGEPFSAASLSTLPNQIQAEANRMLCNSRDPNGLEVYVFFTDNACGERIENPPPPARKLYGRSPGLSVYEIPFVVMSRSRKHNEFVASEEIAGSLVVRAGDPTPAEFQVLMSMGTRSTGDPAFLEPYFVFDGPVYIAGIPFFRGAPGPYFLSGFASGLCPAITPTGCSAPRGTAYFDGVGNVPPNQMYPSPLAPCYGNACPQMSSGLSWLAPAIALPAPDLLDEASVLVQGDAQVYLEANSAGDQVTVTTSAGSSNLLITNSTTYVVANSGDNLAFFTPPSATQAPGWTTTVRASGEPGILELTDRDGYYGEWFTIGNARTFPLSYEANADNATAPFQVGLQWTDTDSGDGYAGAYGWVGTGWSNGINVPPGSGWQRVDSLINLPANAKRARIWVQIDALWGSTGTARFRNLVVQAPEQLTLPIAQHPATKRIVGVDGRITSLAGPLAGVAYWGRTPFTLAATNSITITGSLRTGEPPCTTSAGLTNNNVPTPSSCQDPVAQMARGERGILGIYSRTGNILFDSATDHYTINAALLAPQGSIGLTTYPSGNENRTITLTGALASFYFDGFKDPGTNSPNPSERGYATYFSYDPRLSADAGLVPEGWPRLQQAVWSVGITLNNKIQ